MVDRFECRIMTTMAMISNKWKVLIVCKLRDGTLRFNEIMRSLQGVSQKVLTSQLRELEDDGLVARKVYAEVPPRVEYTLTPLGRTLVPVLNNLEQWAEAHADEIVDCRTKAEKKHKRSVSKTEATGRVEKDIIKANKDGVKERILA